MGIVAALGAGVMLGTMYIPYRKAYISGMNPLSFVTIFTFGELGTVSLWAQSTAAAWATVVSELHRARPMLFWPFLGGFCWVIGDLFQQYAAKYIGIGRGIPLSNTNQLWGLAWGALVFAEFSGLSPSEKALVVTGSLMMILGAISISMADPGESELVNWRQAMNRECDRYGLNAKVVAEVVAGDDPIAQHPCRRALVGSCDCVGGDGRLCLAGHRHAQPAPRHQHALDDRSGGRHRSASGRLRDSAVETNPVLVEALLLAQKPPCPSLRFFSVARVGCHKIRVPALAALLFLWLRHFQDCGNLMDSYTDQTMP